MDCTEDFEPFPCTAYDSNATTGVVASPKVLYGSSGSLSPKFNSNAFWFQIFLFSEILFHFQNSVATNALDVIIRLPGLNFPGPGLFLRHKLILSLSHVYAQTLVIHKTPTSPSPMYLVTFGFSPNTKCSEIILNHKERGYRRLSLEQPSVVKVEMRSLPKFLSLKKKKKKKKG